MRIDSSFCCARPSILYQTHPSRLYTCTGTIFSLSSPEPALPAHHSGDSTRYFSGSSFDRRLHYILSQHGISACSYCLVEWKALLHYIFISSFLPFHKRDLLCFISASHYYFGVLLSGAHGCCYCYFCKVSTDLFLFGFLCLCIILMCLQFICTGLMKYLSFS